jgi:hypothetical protein
VPVLREASQAWSAFVAPDLAAIFEDTPWLDLPPGAEPPAAPVTLLPEPGLPAGARHSSTSPYRN